MNVSYRLKTRSFFDIESRVDEVREILEWIRELVDWDDTRFELKFHSSGQVLVVWFERDEDAVMFLLRWS